MLSDNYLTKLVSSIIHTCKSIKIWHYKIFFMFDISFLKIKVHFYQFLQLVKQNMVKKLSPMKRKLLASHLRHCVMLQSNIFLSVLFVQEYNVGHTNIQVVNHRQNMAPILVTPVRQHLVYFHQNTPDLGQLAHI